MRLSHLKVDTTLQSLAKRQAVWSRHWANGAASSCAGSYADTYGGAIAAFWQRVHADTRAGANVLDLATGSGALPRLLLKCRPDLPMTLHAVDLSTTPPVWMHSHAPDAPAQLIFHAGTRLEALPLPSRSVDLITSQYGIEYGDAEAACREVLRVRAPGGRVALVMHHASSRPVQLAGVEVDHIDDLLAPSGLLDACAAMVEPMSLATTQEGRARLAADPAANAARKAFNAAQTALTAAAQQQPDGADVLGEAQDAALQVLALAVRTGETAAREALARLRQHLMDARWRLKDLQRCALDEVGAQAWVARLGLDAVRPHVNTLHEGPHLMGWTLVSG